MAFRPDEVDGVPGLAREHDLVVQMDTSKNLPFVAGF